MAVAPEERLPPRGPDGRFVAVPRHDVDRVDLSDPALYLNRELSWLEFNRRVLELAGDGTVPLLERFRYLARFHANLDEFFMVRVAGLLEQARSGAMDRTPDGRTPVEQLTAIAARLRPMLRTATTLLHEQLFHRLRRHGTTVVAVADLDPRQRASAARWFADRAFPVLTPLAVDPGRPFPYISNLSLSLAVTVRHPRRGATSFARVKVPDGLPRFVAVDGDAVLVLAEDIVRAHLDELFPGLEVLASHTFRVTRDARLALGDAGTDDLLVPVVEDRLRRRRFGAVVRLEVDGQVPDDVTALLRTELGVSDQQTYRVSGGLLGGADLVELADRGTPRLRWPTRHPGEHPRLRRGRDGAPPDVFAEIRRGDILLHHPYDGFAQTVERFLVQASEDERVLAIKQTLYRTSGDSRIAEALVHAAQRGKQVVALVEVTARFDEETNIVWARELERAGVHVVYGLVGLKTHAKTTLVVRREQDGLRRYVHIGTGNYNSVTARTEVDLGLLTCAPELGTDLTDLFNALTGYGRRRRFRRLLVAPWGMRERLLSLIDRETELHRRGAREGLVRIKANAMMDPEVIAALYRASQAGVAVRLVIRGICGLRPGIPGLSDTIEVTSTLGRFLEHSRIMQFGPDDCYIGSADLMRRNLDRRVEVMAPVTDPELRDRVRELFDIVAADTAASWRLGAGGSWSRVRPRYDQEAFSSQEHLIASSRDDAAASFGTPRPR